MHGADEELSPDDDPPFSLFDWFAVTVMARRRVVLSHKGRNEKAEALRGEMTCSPEHTLKSQQSWNLTLDSQSQALNRHGRNKPFQK